MEGLNWVKTACARCVISAAALIQMATRSRILTSTVNFQVES